MTTQLAIVKIDGKYYFQDNRLQEYRETTNPHNRIKFEDIGERMPEPVEQKLTLKPAKRKLR